MCPSMACMLRVRVPDAAMRHADLTREEHRNKAKQARLDVQYGLAVVGLSAQPCARALTGSRKE